MDESGRTFDRYGRWVFHDDKEQTVEELTEEEGELIPQPQEAEERDSEEIPLSELRQRPWELLMMMMMMMMMMMR